MTGIVVEDGRVGGIRLADGREIRAPLVISNADVRQVWYLPSTDGLLSHDQYLLLADYADCVKCHERVGVAHRDEETWTRMSILDAARFFVDRTTREYFEAI